MEEREYQAMYSVEAEHWWFISRRKFVKRLLGAIGVTPYSGKAVRIADIGAGTGGMIRFLNEYGTVTGIEPNTSGRKLAKKRGIMLRNGTAEHTGLISNTFDIVCFFDVLYHDGINDERAIGEARRILKPGGLLIITDCALPYLSGPHDRAVQGRERYILSRFIKKVERIGFIPLKTSYTFFLLFPLVLMKRLLDRYSPASSGMHSDVRPAPLLVSVCCIAINTLEAMGLRYLSYPWGSSLVILARKKGRNP